MNDTTTLWRAAPGPRGPGTGAPDEGDTLCVMISCCAGAELQLRRGDTVVLRELYPDKATLYERARALRALHAAPGSAGTDSAAADGAP